jgi:hypothetical protein
LPVRSLIFILCGLFLAFPLQINAQSDPGDTLLSETIDSIIIDNNNIFFTDSSKYDNWIYRLANKLHIRTKKYVIRRELLQNRGDRFSRRLADETERNLRAMPYLWRAGVELYRSGDSLNIMRISTSDTWTLVGGLSINRTAEQLTYHFRAEELNLFGTGQSISFHFYIREFEDDYIKLSYLERRLFGSRTYIGLDINDHPEVGTRSIYIGKPFYSLSSTTQFYIDYSSVNRQNLYYSDGSLVAYDYLKGNAINFEGNYRFGSYHNKLTFGIMTKYKDFRVSDKTTASPTGDFRFAEDSAFYALIPAMSFFNFNYIATKRIDQFSVTEDILISRGAKIVFGSVFDNSDGNELYKIAEFQTKYDTYFKTNMIFLGFYHKWYFKESVWFRKWLRGSIKYYNNAVLWYTPALNIEYDMDLYKNERQALYLGENNGLRGYVKNYSTGERRFKINFENRFFTGIRLFTAEFGAVQFIDIGRSWEKENKLNFRDLLWSVGAGLRLSAEKISGARMMRLDVAYAGVTKRWQLSFGVGHYF